MTEAHDELRAAVAEAPAFEAMDEPTAESLGVSPETLKVCAKLDASDTDNATRFMAHFGDDFLVIARDGAAGGDWIGWAGTHWDAPAGEARAALAAQKIGALIRAEAAYLDYSASEKDRLATASQAERAKIDDALAKRRARRRGFGVTSSNSGRIANMQTVAAPRLRIEP